MRLKKNQAKFAVFLIDSWQQEGALAPLDSEKLKNSIEITTFDWQRLSKYSFWAAIACVVIAIGCFLLDSSLIKTLLNTLSIPITFILWAAEEKWPAVVVLALISAGFYYYAYRRTQAKPKTVFRNQAIVFLGVIFNALALGFLENWLPIGSTSLLIGVIIYGLIAVISRSGLTWLFALISLSSWLGFMIGYNFGTYYVGTSYPDKFVLIGLILGLVSIAFQYGWPHQRFSQFSKITLIVGSLQLFISLWIMSLWGLNGDKNQFFWSIIFGATACAYIYLGLRHDYRLARNYGINFSGRLFLALPLAHTYILAFVTITD
jgi:hypothetical protein